MGRRRRRGRSPTRAAVRCTTCGSRSPTAATSAASTACRATCSTRTIAFLPHAELLTFEEIARVAALFVERGVAKIRLTGGEPLLRRNVERLVEMLARTGVTDLTLTTNGSLLAKKAQALRDAGLDRVTVSLDSLDDATFRTMNDADFPVAKVLEGIDAAAAAGLAPVKINAVVKRGMNDATWSRWRGTSGAPATSSASSSSWTSARPTAGGWTTSCPRPRSSRRSAPSFRSSRVDPNYAGEVAERWRYRDGEGEIGVIASVTQAFCRDCSRARLSTDGRLYTCLFATEGYDLRALVRGGFDDVQIGRAIAAVWRRRDDRYSEIRTANTARLPKVEMSYIGG